MKNVINIILAILAVVLISIGAWFTDVAYKKDTSKESKWIQNHIQTLKWSGPLLIAVGVIFLVVIIASMMSKKWMGGEDKEMEKHNGKHNGKHKSKNMKPKSPGKSNDKVENDMNDINSQFGFYFD